VKADISPASVGMNGPTKVFGMAPVNIGPGVEQREYQAWRDN
jgi:hypothetical protein